MKKNDRRSHARDIRPRDSRVGGELLVLICHPLILLKAFCCPSSQTGYQAVTEAIDFKLTLPSSLSCKQAPISGQVEPFPEDTGVDEELSGLLQHTSEFLDDQEGHTLQMSCYGTPYVCVGICPCQLLCGCFVNLIQAKLI